MNRVTRGVVLSLAALALAATLPSAPAEVAAMKSFDDEFARGMDLVRSGQATRGLELVRQAAARATGPNADAAQTGLGAAYLAAGKVGDARAALRGPIDRSAYVPATIELARTYLYAPPFDPKKAIELLRAALAREPRNLEAMLELARALVNDSALEPALDLYEKLTEEIAPKDLRCWLGLGDAQILQKRFDKARTAYRAAVGLSPRDPEPYFKMGELSMADEAEPDHLQKALGWYERAVELGRETPKYYGALTYAYYRNGNNLAAAPLLARLESFAAGTSTAAWAKGVFAEFMGKTSEALRLYKEAVALDGQDPYARYTLGMITSGRRNADFVMIGSDRDWKYLPLRDLERSQSELKTALALSPGFPFAARARAVLEELQSTPSESPPDTPQTREARQKLDDYFRMKAKLF